MVEPPPIMVEPPPVIVEPPEVEPPLLELPLLELPPLQAASKSAEIASTVAKSSNLFAAGRVICLTKNNLPCPLPGLRPRVTSQRRAHPYVIDYGAMLNTDGKSGVRRTAFSYSPGSAVSPSSLPERDLVQRSSTLPILHTR